MSGLTHGLLSRARPGGGRSSDPPRTARSRWRYPLLALLALPSLVACQPKIGAPCKRARDCGTNVVRQCDVSNLPRDPDAQGECTIENCSFGVCPDEAVCVKVYASEFLSIACDFELEDIDRDDCAPNEVCLPEGLCADEIRARTSCRLECQNDGDCRSNYECRATGFDGIYVAPDPADPTMQNESKICVPS